MQCLDEYAIISHFQALNPTKLIVWNANDTSIYIDDFNTFFGGYGDKSFRFIKPIASNTRYIECILEGNPYIVQYNETTKVLLK